MVRVILTQMAATKQSSSEAVKKVEEQITCPICLEHFTNPKLVPCGHSFCLQCLQRVPIELVNGSHYLPCPTCRVSCPVPDKGVASLPPSFVINNLIEVYDLLKKVSDHQHASCDICDDNNADRYCKQCAKFLCPQCLHHHNNWKPNVSHQIISLDEVASSAYLLTQAKPDPTMICSDHDKPLDIFCNTCQQLICCGCTVSKKHKDHDYDLVTDTYKQHKDAIVQYSLRPLNQEFDRLQRAKLLLFTRKNKISQQCQTAIEEIDHAITQIKNHLDVTGRKLKKDARLALKHKDYVLDQQIKEIDTAIVQVSEYRDHVDQCVKVGTPQQLLLTKPQITSHSQNVIKSVKDKTFEPVEQADIRLVKSDKINQIHNNIGTVSFTLRLARLKVSRRHIPLTGRESTITISLSHPNGSPASVPLSLVNCRLTPPNNTCPIQCSIKESSHLGQYNVVFTPAIRGLHQLHVTINGNEIPGSPVSVPVSVPPEMRSTPVKTITRLNGPSGVAVTDDGLVIVCGRNAHCITIFNRKGKEIKSIGTFGNGRGQLQYPQGVAVTSKGTVLVSDTYNYRIQQFTIEGVCISCTGTEGNGPLQFNCPAGLAINKITGQVIVADHYNHRVQVLQPDLTFSHMLGSRGPGQGQFECPSDVTIDSQGFVYVTDQDNHRVQKFTPEGQFVSSFGTKGDKLGQLNLPTGITVDDNDLLYVYSSGSGYVTVYTTNGQYISRIKSEKNSTYCINGVTLDSNGDLYVCQFEHGKIIVL